MARVNWQVSEVCMNEVWHARSGIVARDPRHGVIAIAKGVFPVLMACPALLVAVVIGVTMPAFQFVT